MTAALLTLLSLLSLPVLAGGTVVAGQDAGKDMTGCDSSVFIGRAAGAKANNVDGSVGIGFGALLGAKNKQGVTYLNGHLYASQPDDEFYIRGDRSVVAENSPIYYKNGTLNLNASAVSINVLDTNTVLEFLRQSYGAYWFNVTISGVQRKWMMIYPTSSGATTWRRAAAACEMLVEIEWTSNSLVPTKITRILTTEPTVVHGDIDTLDTHNSGSFVSFPRFNYYGVTVFMGTMPVQEDCIYISYGNKDHYSNTPQRVEYGGMQGGADIIRLLLAN